MRSLVQSSSILVVLTSIAISFAFVSESGARPAICGKLERQLVSAGSSSSGGSNKFGKAAQAQAQQLQIARGQARNAGCNGSFLSFDSAGANKATCSRITSTIRRMEVNLAKLQSKSGSSVIRPNRSRILAALDANDCNGRVLDDIVDKRKLPTAVKPKEPGFLTILFGGGTKPKKIQTTYQVTSAEKPGVKKSVTVINGGDNTEATYKVSGGTFRTLCVRTCDGYYFPVSFSTTSSRFATDEKACASMCPGTETKLYVHSVPDQEPEEMISLRKEPYSALPTAFQYRRDGIGADPSCTCQAAVKQVTDDLANADSAKGKSKWIPYPSNKPALLDDEETRVNRVGGLDATSINTLLQVKLSTQTLASQQNVRVVGPVFLPAQSTVTGSPVQDRLSVQ